MSIQRWFRVVMILGSVVLVAACNTLRPTHTNENPERRMSVGGVEQEPVRISPETVVIDARKPVEYTMARIPKSISMQWADYTEPEPAQRGVLQEDLFAITRRLARYGINPDSQVVVVGSGVEGQGEEGRIAWMLSYLGVRNVQFADLDYFKVTLTTVPNESSLKSLPIWKPVVDKSLLVTRDELLGVLNKGGVHQPVSLNANPPVLYKIIDVRTSQEYLGKKSLSTMKRAIPNMDAVNIPWHQFFDKNLRIRPEIAEQLMGVGIEPLHRIIVLDENGVSSAAVTMALRSLGYKNTGNYAGGLTDLLSAYPNK